MAAYENTSGIRQWVKTTSGASVPMDPGDVRDDLMPEAVASLGPLLRVVGRTTEPPERPTSSKGSRRA